MMNYTAGGVELQQPYISDSYHDEWPDTFPRPADLTAYNENNVQTAYERHMYRLSPKPPVYSELQTYIELYLIYKHDAYFEWFLHYYEPTINRKVEKYIRNFCMDGHFTGLKSACVYGIWLALSGYSVDNETPFIVFMQRTVSAQMLEYVREMRHGLSVPKASTFRKQRKIMAEFNALGGQLDDSTVAEIAKRFNMSEETAERHIRLCLRAQNVVSMDDPDVYDEADDEARERLITGGYGDPEQAYFAELRADEVMSAYEQLDYRERDIVAARLDFCIKCYSVTQRDSSGLNRQGSKKPTFEELANSYGLRSADAAEDIYNKAVGKMRGMLE